MKAKARRQRRRAEESTVDHGTPERARHGELVRHETMDAGVVGKRVKHECRLDWYADKGSIVDRQYDAGLRFRRDWAVAASSAKVTGTYGPQISRAEGRQDFTEMQLAARRRIAAAVALLGRDLAPIVIDVCCFDEWASGRLPALRDALTMLADHYGLARAASEKAKA